MSFGCDQEGIMTTIAAYVGWPALNIGNESRIGLHALQVHKRHSAFGRVDSQQFSSYPNSLVKKDIVSFSGTARDYLENKQSEAIGRLTNQINLAAKIVSSSSTSDSQRFASIASAYHLFFEGGTLGAITGSFASAWGRFKAAASDSAFAQYYAFENQVVPSTSSTAEVSDKRSKPDLWTQFFVNKPPHKGDIVSRKFSRDLSLSLYRDNSSSEEMPQNNAQLNVDRLLKAQNALYNSTEGSEPLISLVNIEGAVTPREKQVLEKILNSPRKKTTHSSKDMN